MGTYADRFTASITDAMRADLTAAGYTFQEDTPAAAVAAMYRDAFPAVTCRHCERVVHNVRGTWTDPEATGDDSLWRETCQDNHEDRVGAHEPMG